MTKHRVEKNIQTTALGWLILAVGIAGSLYGAYDLVRLIRGHETGMPLVLAAGYLVFKVTLLATGIQIIGAGPKALWTALASLIGATAVAVFQDPAHILVLVFFLHLLLFLFLNGSYYLVRRILYMIPIIFGVMVITFVLFRVVGGDISSELAGKNALPETIAEIKHEYGWDKPMFINIPEYKERGLEGLVDSQFAHHLWSCITFDFGKSIRYRQNISDIIKGGAIPSLSITVPMFFIEVVTSLAIALIVAYVRGTRIDKFLVVLCVFGMSMPYLSYILLRNTCSPTNWGCFPFSDMKKGGRKFSLSRCRS